MNETSSVNKPDAGDHIQGNKIEGDHIAIDQINGEAVAIGANARATINQYTEIIVKLDNIEDVPASPGKPPFKGLTHFTEEDANIFFGREKLSDKISKRLQSNQFLAVIGASGSGKTSLLQAGVVPRLRKLNWLIHIITPTSQPLVQLASTLTRDTLELKMADKVEASLAANPRTLYLATNKLISKHNAHHLLLIVDQFEELFTQCQDENLRQAFLDNLLTTATNQSQTTILIGIRADFYESFAQFDGLRELVSQHQELIGPMSQGELVHAIAEPAKRNGWQFMQGLVEQILEDVGKEPGRLPLLSHALLETWERRRGMVMTLGGYRAAGGVEGAIAHTAEETFAHFDNHQKDITKTLFLALTELGEGAEDTRRIVSLTDLQRQIEDPPALNIVLEALVKARLITVGNDHVEVAHEALIRRWPRLQQWLEDNRERLHFERRITQDAKEWERLNYDLGALYRGARLQQAIEWVQNKTITIVGLPARFLGTAHELAETEKREEEEQRKRELERERTLALEQEKRAEDAEMAAARQSQLTRLALVIGGIALVLAILATFFGIASSNNARQAKVAQVRSRANEIASFVQTAILDEQDPSGNLALLLSIQAITTTMEPYGFFTTNADTALKQAIHAAQPNQTTFTNEVSVNSVDWSPDGTQLAAADGTILRVWNYETGEALFQIPVETERINSITWSPLGKYIALGIGDSPETAALLVLDTETGQELLHSNTHRDAVLSVDWSPDGHRIVTGSRDKTAQILDFPSGKLILTLEGHTSPINTVAWSPDGKYIATGGGERFGNSYLDEGDAPSDNNVRVWDAVSGTLVWDLGGHRDRVNSVAWHPDSRYVASASGNSQSDIIESNGLGDFTIRIWEGRR